MEFKDMTDSERAAVVRWCQDHDWYDGYAWMVYGSTLIVYGIDEDGMFTSFDELKQWAGY